MRGAGRDGAGRNGSQGGGVADAFGEDLRTAERDLQGWGGIAGVVLADEAEALQVRGFGDADLEAAVELVAGRVGAGAAGGGSDLVTVIGELGDDEEGVEDEGVALVAEDVGDEGWWAVRYRRGTWAREAKRGACQPGADGSGAGPARTQSQWRPGVAGMRSSMRGASARRRGAL